ncbi:PREDICTED: cytoplasmic tRNA 2-thiolation protein 2-like isoform X2 [Priapulus caudatus]|uniref:Cytoplasmic tRNA 2-thiolation protein 2 n=1 Tax=Priapulus caudatus TaxID=37621 RepID=A0ABM1DXI2_PRICU|nr:PREDICTED: cytoplasmic tRNA 2-thiolation protein 2-like isoform X2 [Priapulus caudatus]
MKCDNKPVVVVRVNDAFCRECFLTYFTHKFRATIGKSKLVREGEKVLLTVSGGQASCAMLNLVNEGLGKSVHKRLRFSPSILYIDEGAVLGMCLQERSNVQEKVLSSARKTGFPCFYSSLEMVMACGGCAGAEDADSHGDEQPCHYSTYHGVDDCEGLHTNVDMQRRLTSLFEATRTITAKEDLLNVLRMRLMVHIAIQEGFTKLMVGDTGTRLAVRVMSNVAQGRGSALALDTGFSDDRHGIAVLLRPMMDFTGKEIVMYNRFHDIRPVTIAAFTTKSSCAASITKLSQTFVLQLQEHFPSTINTICRTAGKICEATDLGSKRPAQCCMCKISLDTSVVVPSALQSVLYSQSLATKAEELSSPSCESTPSLKVPAETNCCENTEPDGGTCCSQRRRDERMTSADLCGMLCYGCRLIIHDMDSIENLPHDMVKAVATQSNRAKIKEEILEFLLDDD